MSFLPKRSSSPTRSAAPAGRPVGLILLLALLLVLGLDAVAARADEPLFARLETDEGNITLVFYPDLAPHHVANFVHLARTGFFDGTAFHRIVPGFVIQGGDPLSKDEDPRNDGTGGPLLRDVLTDDEWQLVERVSAMLEAKGYASSLNGRANLKAEFSQTAQHVRGTLSMARSRQPDSAGSQFFICVDRTATLDGQYSIFGQAFSGLDVVDTIVGAETDAARGREAPAVPVHIRKATVFSGVGGLTPGERKDWDALPAELKNAK